MHPVLMRPVLVLTLIGCLLHGCTSVDQSPPEATEGALYIIAIDANKSDEVRLTALKSIQQQSLLVRLVDTIGLEHHNVREAAWARLSENTLSSIAKGEHSLRSRVRVRAVELLNSQNTFKEMFLEAEAEFEPAVQAALNRISDAGWLAEQGPAHSVAIWRRAAADRLYELEITDDLTQIKSTADSRLLKSWIYDAHPENVRIAAVRQIADEATLRDIAVSAELPAPVNQVALDRIRAQHFISEVVHRAANFEIRALALDKLDTPDLLEQIALTHSEKSFAIAAVQKLSSQSRLKRVVAEGQTPEVRAAAVSQISDNALMINLAMSDPHWQVRSAAVVLLNDQAILQRIAMQDDLWLVRFAATERLKDQAALFAIAQGGQHRWERLAATARLTSAEALRHFQGQDNQQSVLAELQLAILEQSDESLRLVLYLQHVEKRYGGEQSLTLQGELVRLELKSDRLQAPVEAQFTTRFPKQFTMVESAADRLSRLAWYEMGTRQAEFSVGEVMALLDRYRALAVTGEN